MLPVLIIGGLTLLLSACTSELATRPDDGQLPSDGKVSVKRTLVSYDMKPAWALFRNRQTTEATETILDLREKADLDPVSQAELALLQGLLLAENRKFESAGKELAKTLSILERHGYQKNRLTKAFTQNLTDLKIRVYSATNQLAKLTDTWIESLHSAPHTDRRAIVENIWSNMQKMPANTLREQMEEHAEQNPKGWYELGLTNQEAFMADRQYRNYQVWRSDWPNHPAFGNPPTELRTLPEALESLPRRIAVMLPLSGSLANAGLAVQQGILAAHFHSTSKSEISFFDTGGEQVDMNKLYRQAVQEGAELIIGPLQKALLFDMLSIANRKVNILLLNYFPEDETAAAVPSNLYQFGLAPADELTQLTQRARREAGKRTLIIHSTTPWGRSNAEKIAQRWEELDGTVVKRIAVDKPQSAFDVVAGILDVDNSIKRNKSLSKLLGKPLGFSPRSRQDLDLIMLVAEPGIANAVKPALNYHLVEPVPVYATSRSIPGNINLISQFDLSGILYCDLPWRIHSNPFRPALEEVNREAITLSYGLFALGVDAIEIGTRLEQFKRNPDIRIQGTTGRISLDDSQRFQRQLAWATITEEGAVPLLPLPEEENPLR